MISKAGVVRRYQKAVLQTEKGSVVMDKKLSYKMSIRLFEEDKAFGPGIAVLLHKIDELGSLQKAALSMNMAYSKAWKMITAMERQWGFPLTERETGARHGGGSTLTVRAKLLVDRYDEFMNAARCDIDGLFEEYFSGEWMDRLSRMDEGSDKDQEDLKG